MVPPEWIAWRTSSDAGRISEVASVLFPVKGHPMPYVNLKITRGPEVTRERKAELVAGINQLLVQVLGKKPEHIHIVIDEIDTDNWGFAGMLTSEYRKTKER